MNSSVFQLFSIAIDNSIKWHGMRVIENIISYNRFKLHRFIINILLFEHLDDKIHIYI